MRGSEGIWPKAEQQLQVSRNTPAPQTYPRKISERNIFRDTTFFTVPIALYDNGVARLLKPSHLIRYVTLCRLANYSSSPEISISLEKLYQLDGVSPRSAYLAHRKLQEYGMIRVVKNKPFTYRIEQSPELWEPNFGRKIRLSKAGGLNIEEEYF